MNAAGEDARPKVHRPGGLLWKRDFGLLWFGETVSQVGTAMAVVAMPLVAVSVLHASTLTVTALVAMTWLPWLLIGLPAGAWVDRLSCRAVMLVCDVVALVLYASVPLAAYLGVLTIGQLLAVGLLGGAVSVFFSTAYQAYLPSLIRAEQLVEGNAKMQGSAAAAQLGGPGLAGLVAQALGVTTALMFNAASFLVSAICLLSIRASVPRPARTSGRPTLRADMAEGARFVARDPYLRPMGLFGAIVNFGLSANQALAVVFLVRVVGVGPLAVGLLLAVPGVSGMLGALTARCLTERVGTARTMLLSTLAALPFGLLIPLTRPGWGLAFYAAGTLIAATGVAMGRIIMASFRQAYSPPRLRGRVTATMSMLFAVTSPPGALIGGVLAASIGTRETLWLMLGSVGVAGAVLLTGAIRQNRDLPATPQLGMLIRPDGPASAEPAS
jgi:predicted MFS family arabinose efflux permease